MCMEESIESLIKDSIKVKEQYLNNINLIEPISKVVNLLVNSYQPSGATKHFLDSTLYIFGNGGSAADAQHIAAEFVNKFFKCRGALPAMALTTDTSVLTSIANDADYRYVFSRQIEAFGRPSDIALGISTSGKSPNVLEGLRRAKERGLKTIMMCGDYVPHVNDCFDIAISVPSNITPRIQEMHITIAHIICELVERKLFN